MADFRLPRRERECNLDHVEAERARRRAQLAQVSIDRTTKNPLLAAIDCKKSGDQRRGGPRFHFDKHQHTLVAADEVKFITAITRVAPIAGND